MKKKRKVNRLEFLYLVIAILLLAAQYLIYKKPQNLTKEAGVFKKPELIQVFVDRFRDRFHNFRKFF